MVTVSTCLWFDGKAEEAANFYVSLLDNAAIERIDRNAADNPGGGKKGEVVTVTFHLNGTRYTLLNGGPYFKLSPAASIVLACPDQAEVDRLWDALLEGGEPMQCGWLTDRYGLTWQVVPEELYALLASDDEAAVKRMTEVMFDMVKLDIGALKRAFEGR